MNILFCSLRFSRTYSSRFINIKKPNEVVLRLLSKQLCSKVEDKIDRNVAKHNYSEIYRFPLIVMGYTLHKIKWFQTLVTGGVLPITVLLYFSGLITPEWCLAVTSSACLVTVNLYGYAQLFHKAVGFLYLSEDGTMVKISYLDFWGNRIDEEVPLSDVMTFSDAPQLHTDILYKQITFHSDKTLKPKLYLIKGQITDKEKFIKVFGDSELIK